MSLLAGQFRFGGRAVVTVADSALPTILTEEQWNARQISLQGVLTANRVVRAPLRPGWDWDFINDCTGGFSVTVEGATGDGVSLEAGDTQRVITDGVDFFSGGGGSSGGAGGVDQYAALRALTPGVSSVSTVGKAGTVRAGGGQFGWDEDAILSPEGLNDNGGTHIKPDSIADGDPGRWVRVIDGRVNAAWFGLWADDLPGHDDGPRLQAALDFCRIDGKELYIPPAPFKYPLWVTGTVYAGGDVVATTEGHYFRCTNVSPAASTVEPGHPARRQQVALTQTIGGCSWELIGGARYRLETQLQWHDASIGHRPHPHRFAMGPRITGAGKHKTILNNQTGKAAISVDGTNLGAQFYTFFDGGYVRSLAVDSIPRDQSTIGFDCCGWWHGLFEDVVVINQGAHGWRFISAALAPGIDGDSCFGMTIRRSNAYFCGGDYGVLARPDQVLGGAGPSTSLGTSILYGWGFYFDCVDGNNSMGGTTFDTTWAYECVGGGAYVKGVVKMRLSDFTALGCGADLATLAPSGRMRLPISRLAAGIRIADGVAGGGFVRGLTMLRGEMQGNANANLAIEGGVMFTIDSGRWLTDDLDGFYCMPWANILLEDALLGGMENIQIKGGMVRSIWQYPTYALWNVATSYTNGTGVSNSDGRYYTRTGGTGSGGSEPTHTSGTSGNWIYAGIMSPAKPWWKTGKSYANAACVTNNTTRFFYKNISGVTGTSGATEPNHTVPEWVGSVYYDAGDHVVTVDGNHYTAIAAGTATATKPTHTSGAGGTNWTWVESIADTTSGTIVWAFQGPGGFDLDGVQRGLAHIRVGANARGTVIGAQTFMPWMPVAYSGAATSTIHKKLVVASSAVGLDYRENIGEVANSRGLVQTSITTTPVTYTPDSSSVAYHRFSLTGSASALTIAAPSHDLQSPITFEFVNGSNPVTLTFASAYYPNGGHTYTMEPNVIRKGTFMPTGGQWVLVGAWVESHNTMQGRASVNLVSGTQKDIGLTENNRETIDFVVSSDTTGTGNRAFVPPNRNKRYTVRNTSNKDRLYMHAGTIATATASQQIRAQMADSIRQWFNNGTSWLCQTTPETKEGWTVTDVVAARAIAAMDRATTFRPVRGGSVTGLWLRMKAALTAGTITATVYINGKATTLTLTMAGAMSTVHARGGSIVGGVFKKPPVATISGTPDATVLGLIIRCTTGGANGTFVYEWSIDDGANWTTGVTSNLTPGTVEALGGGLSVAFAAGTATDTTDATATSVRTVWTSSPVFLAATQAVEISQFLPGDRVEVWCSTSAGFLPSGSIDLEAGIEVQY